MNFEYFLQLFLSGLTRGSIYALIALGYTMVYGIIELINFAHGEIYMIGAFMGLIVSSVLTLLGLPQLAILVLACLVAVVYAASYGWTMEKSRLQAGSQCAASLGAHQRYRHVHIFAKLCPSGSNVQFSALPGPDSRTGILGAIFPYYLLGGSGHHCRHRSLHDPAQPADKIHPNGQGHAGHGSGSSHGHAGRRETSIRSSVSRSLSVRPWPRWAAYSSLLILARSISTSASSPASKPSRQRFWAESGASPEQFWADWFLGWTESFATGYVSSDYEDVFAFLLLVFYSNFQTGGFARPLHDTKSLETRWTHVDRTRY